MSHLDKLILWKKTPFNQRNICIEQQCCQRGPLRLVWTKQDTIYSIKNIYVASFWYSGETLPMANRCIVIKFFQWQNIFIEQDRGSTRGHILVNLVLLNQKFLIGNCSKPFFFAGWSFVSRCPFSSLSTHGKPLLNCLSMPRKALLIREGFKIRNGNF